MTKKQKNKTIKTKSQKTKEVSSDWWDEISEAERASIIRGLEDIKAGRVVPHEKVKKIYQKFLDK